jgi:hypothetical protein
VIIATRDIRVGLRLKGRALCLGAQTFADRAAPSRQ